MCCAIFVLNDSCLLNIYYYFINLYKSSGIIIAKLTLIFVLVSLHKSNLYHSETCFGGKTAAGTSVNFSKFFGASVCVNRQWPSPIARQHQQEPAGILLLIVSPWPPLEVAGAESGRLMGRGGLVVEYQRLVLVHTTQLIGCTLYCWKCSGVAAVLHSLV